VLALYAELEAQADALRRASDLKSSFLSNVSHELRTPIASVINLARLLLDESLGGATLDVEQRRQLGFIQRAGEALHEMVSSLLDLARIEAGRMAVRYGEVPVDELLATLRGMFRPLATDANVALVFAEVPPGLSLVTDEGKLAQILRNLVGNALKFTEQGEVRVAAVAEGEDQIRFSVSDTGIGIPAEHQERIFQEFEQVANPLQARARGVGLGLPVSRSLAQLLGGTLTVASTPGRGSTFILRLPRKPAGPASGETAGVREAAGV
jgi:signal transduction histidine kinase